MERHVRPREEERERWREERRLEAELQLANPKKLQSLEEKLAQLEQEHQKLRRSQGEVNSVNKYFLYTKCTVEADI